MPKKKIIIIGAGASGLTAAGTAAVSGAEVILVEKMNIPGKKLRITGKGRCNITNIAGIRDFIEHFGKNGKFLRQAFSFFFNTELVQFLNTLGVNTVTERGGRVFPGSNDANEVTDALVQWNKKEGVKIRTNTKADKLLTDSNRITGVEIVTVTTAETDKQNKEIIKADAVILASGGASYPGTGSTGDGYSLAKSAGHSVIPVRPALIPLDTEGDTASHLEGLSLKNINVSLWINDKKNSEEFGEMVFTSRGVSGPVILTLSKTCVDSIYNKDKVFISIDLKPALDHKALDSRLIRDISSSPTKTAKNLLKGLLPERLIAVCLDQIKLNPDKTANQITAEERKKLRLWLKDFRLKVTGHRPLKEAIITAGGVDVREINPRTMESKIINGLYFAGEIIDIDADTGGYNLQAAFSTGRLAGISAASDDSITEKENDESA
ncbi:MAG: NAD(P)/FAD-dependent oxidoreductase [Spirochaetes bacterium]|nr:NAD(P)/FAD-dependent oxidoreductase [Spirochaetota bacterium]